MLSRWTWSGLSGTEDQASFSVRMGCLYQIHLKDISPRRLRKKWERKHWPHCDTWCHDITTTGVTCGRQQPFQRWSLAAVQWLAPKGERGGKLKKPSVSMLKEWILTAWERISRESTVAGFKMCCISNALDCTGWWLFVAISWKWYVSDCEEEDNGEEDNENEKPE
jgi:hypothetical protein